MGRVFLKSLAPVLLIIALFWITSPHGAAYHISTAEEGLLGQDGCYIGAYLGGSRMAPGPDEGFETWIRDYAAFNSATGKSHRLFSRYVSLQNVLSLAEHRDGLNASQWAGTVIGTYDAVPVIFLVPWDSDLDLTHVYPDGKTAKEHIDQFASDLAPLPENGQNTVIIVFGHEMESQDIAKQYPERFTSMFRYAADRFHAAGCLMAWCTNANDNPFNPPDPPQITWWPGSENPTYPGQKPGTAYVDWVAQTRYHFWWGSNTLTGIKGEYQQNPDPAWYNYFGKKLGFPLMIVETAGQKPAPYTPDKYWNPDPYNKSTQEFSNELIPYLYNAQNLRSAYPLIKAIIWFDTIKNNDNGQPVQNYLIPPGRWIPGNPGSVSPLSGTTYTDAISPAYFIGNASFHETEPPGSSGSLYVSTIPIGMSIRLDGADRGRSPQTFNGLSPGTHAVILQKEGFTGQISFVSIRAGETTILFTRLEPINGSLMISSIPEDAVVLLDGKEAGITPVTVNTVRSGYHRLTVRKEGFQNWSRNLSFSGGPTEYILATLIPATGKLRVLSSPDGAEVLINGTFSGITPIRIRAVDPGRLDVAIRKPGYVEYRAGVTIASGRTTIVNAGLVPGTLV